MNAPPGPLPSRDRPSRCEWCPRAVRPGLHPQWPDPGRVKTWPLSRPTRTPRPRIPSRLGEDLVHGDGKRGQCRSLPAPPGPPLAVPRAFSCGRGMRWDGPAPLQSGNAELQGKLYLQTIATFRCRKGHRDRPRMRDEVPGQDRGAHFRALSLHCVHCVDPRADPVHGPARPSTSRLLAMTPSPTQRCIPLSPRYRQRRRP